MCKMKSKGIKHKYKEQFTYYKKNLYHISRIFIMLTILKMYELLKFWSFALLDIAGYLKTWWVPMTKAMSLDVVK